ncbi:GD24791 [Drosophila simulans]|uniref:GD24791 n=1 Tax=Drosophila simulans TaxID=7240 RepID=B4NUB1_DROSI|nr:GD24791 [Drosophila simulans]
MDSNEFKNWLQLAMAYTIKLDWIRWILKLCGSRQCRLMHDDAKTRICAQSPWRRLMQLTRNNSSSTSGGNEPRRQNPNKPKPNSKQISYTEGQTPFRINTHRNANLVRLHPLVRDQDKRTKRHKRRLPFEKSATLRLHNAQRREEQLARTMLSQDCSGSHSSSSTIPLKILQMTQRDRMMSSQLVIDAMRTRNMERMVRKSEARMLNERVKKLLEKQKEAKVEVKRQQSDDDFTVPNPKIMVPEQRPLEVQAVVQLLKKAISLVHFGHEEPCKVKDVRISRMQTKMDIDGLHPCGSSIDSFASTDNPQSKKAYHMRIRCTKKSKIQIKSNSQQIAAKQKDKTHNKAGGEYSANTDTSHLATSSKPTDLNMNSSIVDPKSFLTKVLDKKEVLSVDQVNNFVENPDVFSKAPKRKPATKSNGGPAKHLPQ